MKRKKVLTILGVSVALVAIVAISLALIFNFGLGGYRFEIAVSAQIYDEGEQEVVIYFTNNNEKTTFKSTVTTSDISFEGNLRGRTVTKVVRTSEISLTVTLGGKCVASSAPSDRNKIVVMGDAVSDGKTYACIVRTVKQSGIVASTVSAEGDVFKSVFEMTSGSRFNEEFINASWIILTNGNGATMDIEVAFDSENMTVTVTVSDFEPSEIHPKPEVKFSEETTSLEREFVFLVG